MIYEIFNEWRFDFQVAKSVCICVCVCVLQIVVATLISSYTGLNSSYKISVVGDIPSGYVFEFLNTAHMHKTVLGETIPNVFGINCLSSRLLQS